MGRQLSQRSFSTRLIVVLSSLAAVLSMVVGASIAPVHAQAVFVQRVRVGSATAFTDAGGNVWSADRAYTPGSYGYTQGAYIWSTSATIANTPDSPLFQHNRHDVAFNYRFDVPNGTYQVRLRFAEIYPNSFGIGRRVFNVAIGGTQVLQNLDVFALAGANTALDETFTSAVTNGALGVSFSSVVSQPEVNAIEVILVSGGSPTSTSTSTSTPTSSPTGTATPIPAATSTWTPMSTSTPTSSPTATSTPTQAATSTSTLVPTLTPTSVSSTSTPTATATSTAVATAPPTPAGIVSRRVRAGSSASYTDTQGNVWAADQIYAPGGFGYTSGLAYATTSAVSGTGDSPLYQTNRHDLAFSYRFDVPNGTYVVRLRFAEIYPNSFAVGRRVENVAIQATPVLQNLDVYAAAGGGDVAVDRTFIATVNNGTLDVALTSVVSQAEINAIEVTSAAASPDFTFSASPAMQTMGMTSTVQFNATVQMTGGFSPNGISLWVTGLPAGVSGTFTPNPLPHEGTSELFLTGDGTSVSGTYTVLIGATAQGISHSQAVILVISGQPDFSLAPTPLSQDVSAGGPSISYQIALTPINNLNAPVTLAASGLPMGATASFGPNPVTPGQTSVMTISAASTTPTGTYSVGIVGTSGSSSHATQTTLTVTSGAAWSVTSLGATGSENNSMRVGPGRGDGVNRLYIGTVTTGRVVEFSWNGTGWSGGVDIGGSPAGVEIHNLGIGPGRNDGVNRVYACSLDGNLYEISYANGAWSQTTVGSPTGYCTHAAVGRARSDSVDRLYATRGLYVWEYTWDAPTATWTVVAVGRIASGLAHGISIGTGRGGSTNYLYVATTNSGTYEGSFSDGSWSLDPMGDAGDVRNVNVGTGRNDGVIRVYAATQSGEIREFTWNGTRWVFAPIVTPFGFTLVHAYIAAGRNDGVMRIYSSGADGNVYEFTWTGSSWSTLSLGGGTGYAYGFHLGVGRNDGKLRLYGASFDRLVYEYTFGL